MATQHILEADSIWLNFGERMVLKSIYLKIETGEIVGLLGRNGCGKSCLLRSIFGTQTTENKSVRIDKQYIEKPYQESGVLRYLSQKNFVPSSMRVKTALEYYGVNLPDVYSSYTSQNLRFGELSGGERRFLETLMIVFSPVKFILLDEPFSNISPLRVEELVTILHQQKQNKGIIITDHLYREVLNHSNRLYLLSDGALTALKNPKQDLIDRGYLPDDN